MKSSDQETNALKEAYKHRHALLGRLASALAEHISDSVRGEPRIDRVVARAKDIDRFLTKAATLVDGKNKYEDPLSQIQDQLGARIVVFYKSDVERVETLVRKHFRAIEFKELVPESETEFGYFGRHLVLVVPGDIVDDSMLADDVPRFFELQIKTLFQHAWAEANHDLGYKPGEQELSSEQKRLIAFASAQAWGADHIFDQLFNQRISSA